MRGRKVTSCLDAAAAKRRGRRPSRLGGRGGGIYVSISGGVWVSAGALKR